MKKIIITCFLIIVTQFAYSQDMLDTIFTFNKSIPCEIKELTPDAVKFTYPNESLINSMYKNQIQKIVYKSGRVETFAASTSYLEVKSGHDWEDVSITTVESEVLGLFKLDEVSAKARGTTAMANMNKVKDRAYKKFKIEAAMNAANIVFVVNQDVEGNRSTVWGSNPAETNLSGVAYSTKLPSFEKFSKKIENKNTYLLTEINELGNNDTDLNIKTVNQDLVKILSCQNKGGLIFVNAVIPKIGENEFRVTYYDNDKIILKYRDKKKLYNFILK